MTDIPISLLSHTILFLSLPFIFGYAAYKFRLPTIIGYIAGGIILGFFVKSEVSDVLSFFANLGLILLLFTLGLEIDLSSLRRFSRFVIIGGTIQVTFCSAVSFAIMLLFRVALLPAFILSIGFALSSTAIVSKILSETGEENGLVGKLTLGVLIFQDLVAIPLIVIVSSLSMGTTGLTFLGTLSISIVKSVVIIGLVFILGERIVPPVFERLGKLSRELINLFTIIFIFAAVFLFSILGLSASLAAFVAGVLVGGSLSHHHIFTQMRPMRDLFVILFFVFLGAGVSISIVLPLLPAVIVFALVLIVFKIAISMIIFMRFRFHTKTSYNIAVLLSPVGEFAFILFHLAFLSSLISDTIYMFALSVTIMTMVISPFIIARRTLIYLRLRRFTKEHFPSLERYLTYAIDREPAHIEGISLKDHVVLAGFGRVGSYIGRALTLAHIPYIAVDLNFHIVREARQRDTNIIYGDATDIDILDYLQVERATALVVAIPDSLGQEMIILNAKILNPKIVIFTRVGQEKVQRRMEDLGARVVVSPEFEAALSIVRRLFSGFKLSDVEARTKIHRLKVEHGMV